MLCKCLWTIYCQIEYGFPLQIHDFFFKSKCYLYSRAQNHLLFGQVVNANFSLHVNFLIGSKNFNKLCCKYAFSYWQQNSFHDFLNLFLKTYIVHYFIRGHKTIFCLAKGLVLTPFICTSVLWLVTRILINFVANIPFPDDSKTVSMICFKFIFVDLNRTLLYSTARNHLLFGYM